MTLRRVLVSIVPLLAAAAQIASVGGDPVSSRASSEDHKPPASQPSTRNDETLRITTSVQKLLAGDATLRWSSIDKNPERFEFRITIAVPTSDDGPPRVSQYLVVRDGTHVGVLVTTDEGLPVYFLTDGLFVGLDPDRPGGLCVFEGGDPTISVASSDAGDGLVLDISFVASGHRRRVVLDVASVLRATLRKTKSASSIAGNDGTVRLKTDHAEVTLYPVGRILETDTFGINALSIRTSKGWELTVSHFRASAKSVPRGMSTTNRRLIEDLGLPVRILDANPSTPISLLAVPDGFPHNDDERNAAIKLRTLFVSPKTSPEGDDRGASTK